METNNAVTLPATLRHPSQVDAATLLMPPPAEITITEPNYEIQVARTTTNVQVLLPTHTQKLFSQEMNLLVSPNIPSQAA